MQHFFIDQYGVDYETELRDHAEEREELKQFLKQHFNSDSGGTVYTARRVNGRMEPAYQWGLDELSGRVNIWNTDDNYITGNAFKRWTYGRKQINIYTLLNIVVDLDNHGEELDDIAIARAVNVIIDRLDRKPNSIVFTGRGAQFWYSIEPLSYKWLSAYKKLSSDIFSEVHKAADGTALTADKAPSNNTAGLYRIPGSYNTKTNSYGYVRLLHSDKIDTVKAFGRAALEGEKKAFEARTKREKKQNELRANSDKKHNLSKEEAKKNPNTKQYTGRLFYPEKVNGKADILTVTAARENSIKELIKIRRNQPGTEYRHLIIFYTYSMWSHVLEPASIMEHVNAVNELFREPLDEFNLDAARSKRTKITNKTIIQALEITPEEQARIGLYESSREKDRAAKRQNKQSRNDNIIRMTRAGYSIKTIAEELKISVATVKRVRRTA